MPFDVVFLIAGDPPPGSTSKGDVIEVVPSTSDMGSATVAPNWARWTVTGITGTPDTQQGAEDEARKWLVNWHQDFVYSAVDRIYRIDTIPARGNNLNVLARDAIAQAFLDVLSNGFISDSGQSFVEIDADPGFPEEDMSTVVANLTYRGFFVPPGIVAAALDGVTAGDPATFSHPSAAATSLIRNKLNVPP